MTPFHFRPLQRADLSMLAEWLARPHVREWWGEPDSVADLEADYGPAIDGTDSTRAFIVELDGRPIGFIQAYVAMNSGDGWWPDERDPGTRGVDQFLAHEADLGRGLGSAMVRAFTDTLLAEPGVTRVQTDPSPGNLRAIRAYEKAGFIRRGVVDTPDGPALLLIREPERLAPPRSC